LRKEERRCPRAIAATSARFATPKGCAAQMPHESLFSGSQLDHERRSSAYPRDMGIELWSRKAGIVRPPRTLVHAEPGGSVFPETFRTRVFRWSQAAMQNLYWGTAMGETVNDPRDTLNELYQDLLSAYGRAMLVDFTDAERRSELRSCDQQLPAHLAHCPDAEVLDYIDAVFQKSAQIIERAGGADPVEEPHRLGAEIDRIFEEEGVGYRWTDGRIVRFDGEVTHTQAMVPAIVALATGGFGAAASEFDEAVADFGRGAWRDTITDANAALESVLKIRTGKEGAAGDLIKEALKQGLIPNYLAAGADALAKIMHAVNAARSQQGSAHGLGGRPPEADERLARFVLTTTAALITLLADDSE
jgi:AbiJ-like protein